MADTYAIVESGGKQYRAEQGATLLVDRLPDDEGAKVNLRAVMFRGDGDVVLESEKLEKVKVEAVIAGHERGRKLRVFKYRPKKGYRRRAGHRSELTRLEVTEVKLLSRKPAAKGSATKPKAEQGATKDAKAEPATKQKGAAKEAKAEKPKGKASSATKKAPAKKTAAKGSSTARKPAAKKPAGEKED